MSHCPDPQPPTFTRRVFTRRPWPEARRLAEVLRKETIGGLLLLAAATLALLWANSPWKDIYDSVREFAVGPESLHLHLTLSEWAADGLLAIFFFVAGLELKREFVAGDLRDPRRAALPVIAAISGVVVPAALFILVNAHAGEQVLRGWAIPTATDIAFALAVLAVISTHLPSALRTFLLTLAVVDDLLAIVIIAFFYTQALSIVPLVVALLPLGLFAILVQKRVRSWWILLPLAVLTWGLVHASGVHATVAGVLLAFTVPVLPARTAHTLPIRTAPTSPSGSGLAEHFEHRWRPISAGVAVPVFAFMAAGVTVGGLTGLGAALRDSVAIGVIVGLVVGKTVGILCGTYLVARFTRATLDSELAWVDILGLAMLAGLGFTVSLLIGELAYGSGSERDNHAKVAVLIASLIAALLATVVLRLRNRVYRRIHEAETVDADNDGIPDIYSR